MSDPSFIDFIISLMVLPLQLVNFFVTGTLKFIFFDLFKLGNTMTM